MNTILVPTTFTDKAKKTALYAVQLAKYFNSKIEIFHVIDIYGHGWIYPVPTTLPQTIPAIDIDTAAKESEDEYLQFVEDTVKKQDKQADITFIQKKGFVSKEILDETKRMDIDLIILTGNQDINRLSAINSTIIEETDKPVLVIPPNMDFQAFKNILYVTDYKKEDLKTLKQIALIASAFDAKIYALHLTSDQGFNEKIQSRGFAEIVQNETGNNNIQFISAAGDDIVEIINKYNNRLDANLVTVLKSNRSFFKSIFKSDKTEKIIEKAELPVLIFHE
jgi:nucleotide-binding universal stress UspA family protein